MEYQLVLASARDVNHYMNETLQEIKYGEQSTFLQEKAL